MKDTIAVEGLRMTCGMAAFSLMPSFEAAVVERLLDAGTALVGKANEERFPLGATGENSDFVPVQNPIAEDRVAGGSWSVAVRLWLVGPSTRRWGATPVAVSGFPPHAVGSSESSPPMGSFRGTASWI